MYIQMTNDLRKGKGYVRMYCYFCHSHFDMRVRVVSSCVFVFSLLILPFGYDMSICADLTDIDPVKVECCRVTWACWRILRSSTS